MSSSKFVPLRILLGLQILLLVAVCSGRRMCGHDLTNALRAICGSKYAARRDHKRSEVEDLNDNAYINYDDPMSYLPRIGHEAYPFNFGSTSALNPRFRRDVPVKRGIIEECCLNSCTRNELAKYCE